MKARLVAEKTPRSRAIFFVSNIPLARRAMSRSRPPNIFYQHSG